MVSVSKLDKEGKVKLRQAAVPPPSESLRSSKTDSYEISPELASALSIVSTNSIDVGYWKVKPTDSHMNITVTKSLKGPP